jgi:hypothetical protein
VGSLVSAAGRPPAERKAATRAATGRADRVETGLLTGLAGGLAWAPFWLGGDRLLAWGSRLERR